MSKYQELLNNPIKFNVKKNATQVVINLVSCMCDNRSIYVFNKDDRNLFRLNTGRYAYSNAQIPATKYELEFLADDNKWDQLVREINRGTVLVEKVMSR